MNRIHEQPHFAPPTDLEKSMLAEIANFAYGQERGQPPLRWKDLDYHVWSRSILGAIRRRAITAPEEAGSRR